LVQSREIETPGVGERNEVAVEHFQDSTDCKRERWIARREKPAENDRGEQRSRVRVGKAKDRAMEAPFLSVLVAALAIIVSAAMQYFTLNLTRMNTVSGLRVGVVEGTLTSLRNTLSEYLPISYEIDTSFKHFKLGLGPLDEEHEKWALQEEKLCVLIELSVDSRFETNRRFVEALKKLRDGGSSDPWLVRRDHLIASANELIADERRRALEGA
jgi:hypothetical protein